MGVPPNSASASFFEGAEDAPSVFVKQTPAASAPEVLRNVRRDLFHFWE
jgi:hypothetical protein